jgi:hypothetical protein
LPDARAIASNSIEFRALGEGINTIHDAFLSVLCVPLESPADRRNDRTFDAMALFQGLLQSDGYGGITGLFRGPSPPSKVGFNDHARPRFVEALKLGDQRAAVVVALYGELYAVVGGHENPRKPDAISVAA